MRKRRREGGKATVWEGKFVVLEIRLPARFREGPDVMELFLEALHISTRSSESTFRRLGLSNKAHWSLEILVKDGVLHFAIGLDRRHQGLVAHRLHTFFPDVEVTLSEGSALSPRERGQRLCLRYILEKQDVVPIPSYLDQDYRHSADPMMHLLSTLSSVGANSTVWFQILLKPYVKGPRRRHWWKFWRIDPHIKRTKKFIERFAGVRNQNNQAGRRWGAYPSGSRQLINRMERHLSKPLFECEVRILAHTKSTTKVHTLRPYLTQLLSSYHGESSNSFRGKKVGKSMWALLGTKSMPAKIERAFQGRLFLRRMRFGRRMILSSEALASLFHLPMGQLNRSEIRFSPSRAMPLPPTALPTIGD